ncbi:MAG: paraquat-inducible protein A [Sulfuritalea sp.]|nr:paraquat-inducible protein A [Sulfuritalea sp.]MBK8118000.1 paraquat-inducible protein A [Sulfuritalea sp.]
MAGSQLIACHECDLMQREVPLPRGGVAFCGRCGAELYRSHPDSFERTLAFTVAAIFLFAIANAFPIVGVKLQGQVIQTTLFDTVRTLYSEDMKSVAVLVFVTAMLMPAIKLFALTYLYLPLRLGRAAPHFALVFRMLRAVHPWSMVEVFLLGILVSVIKLENLASVVPGIALWSFGALMLLMAALAAVFDPRGLWTRMEATR